MKIDYGKIIENDFEENLYKRKFDDLINYLNTFGSTDFWTIINEVGGSERRMLRLIDQMVKLNILEFKNNKFNLLNNEFKYKNINLKEIEIIFKEIWYKKPVPTLFFDQRPITYKTSIKRVEYLLKRNDVYNKKIVFLGDDDLTSIALALTNLNCEIVTLDVDERLVNFINQIAQEYNLNLKAYVYNALDKTDSSLKHKFDCLMTDPTPEKIPFSLFMNNAINLLKKENSVIYTSIYSSAMDKTLDLQKIINNMNLYITDIIPNFTKYQALYELYKPSDIEIMKKYNIDMNENSICFTESLFRMELTKDTKNIKLNYQGKDIFGKATKRVIKDRNNDVVKIKDNYLDEVEKMIKENSNKEYISE